MKLEVLVATVNANIKDLIKNMNIKTDAIIINQCDRNEYEEIIIGKKIVRVFHFNERGVGLNRNNSLMRATGDIVLFADDDEVLVDDYEKRILSAFKKNKKADMLVFDVIATGKERKGAKISKEKRLNKFNCLKYGTIRFASRLSSLRKNNIHFSLLFGGGCKYGSGEDSIFLYSCLQNKMKIYTSMEVIANIDFSESSWFKGYNEKYYYDKGALFYSLYRNSCYIFMMLFLLKHKKQGKELKIMEKFNYMLKGVESIKKM